MKSSAAFVIAHSFLDLRTFQRSASGPRWLATRSLGRTERYGDGPRAARLGTVRVGAGGLRPSRHYRLSHHAREATPGEPATPAMRRQARQV
ncbi:MAG TPA: hypothetical protein VF456_22430 [Vicinamibacterales bacterium]